MTFDFAKCGISPLTGALVLKPVSVDADHFYVEDPFAKGVNLVPTRSVFNTKWFRCKVIEIAHSITSSNYFKLLLLPPPEKKDTKLIEFPCPPPTVNEEDESIEVPRQAPLRVVDEVEPERIYQARMRFNVSVAEACCRSVFCRPSSEEIPMNSLPPQAVSQASLESFKSAVFSALVENCIPKAQDRSVASVQDGLVESSSGAQHPIIDDGSSLASAPSPSSSVIGQVEEEEDAQTVASSSATSRTGYSLQADQTRLNQGSGKVQSELKQSITEIMEMDAVTSGGLVTFDQHMVSFEKTNPR